MLDKWYDITRHKTRKKLVSTNRPHFAKNVFFGCIDDRIVESHLKFIIKIGGAFYPAVAGGGLAFIDLAERETALTQVVASYKINKVDTVYIESHTDCGAYRLAGVTFSSPEDEIDRLYGDLDSAKALIQDALSTAGAADGEITIHTRVVNPDGVVVPRPARPAVVA
jgi:carbonic anhydrase